MNVRPLPAQQRVLATPAGATGLGGWSEALDGGGLDRPALHDADGSWTHRQLAAAVDAAAGSLPPSTAGRRLVHLPLRRDRAGVVAHLAVQRAGHVGLALPADAPASITDRWPADVVATGEPGSPFAVVGGDRPRHLLHPDLALLLPTSGSTGSAKLVRLSHTNLESNARAIAEALRLTPEDRGAASLPLHYCFGLSVLHSHLVAGGSIALSDSTVTEDRFWDEVGPATTLPVVPHTLELLEATDRLASLPASLRLVTQAGGALVPALAARARAAGSRAGWGLAVMYGQTEATARLTVLPPELADEQPGAVGWPIGGGSVRVDTTVPEAHGDTGELVFDGPGVMLGYAEEPADLALGRVTDELRTGDLGRVDDDGLVHVVGRRSAIGKILGLRIDLGVVETRLREAGVDACVTSDDERLLVRAGAPARAAHVAAVAASAASLPAHLVAVHVDGPLPRTSTGKVDRARCSAEVLAATRASDVVAPAGAGLEARVLDALTQALGRPARLDRSFADQGGDSFSLVRASLALEGLVGPLPRGWHHRPVGEIVRASSREDDRPGRSLETSVLVRALAVVAICATHVGLVDLPGGAHALLVVAGYHLALFTLAAREVRTRLRRAATVVASVAVPATAVALGVHLTTGAYGWANVVHLNWLLGRVEWGPRIELWFVEALLAAVVVLTAVTAVPRVWQAVERAPWACATVLTLVALVPRWVLVPEGTGPTRGLPGTVFWLVAGGAALALARTRRETLVTLAVLALGLWGFFVEPSRGVTVLALAALVGLVPRVRVPRLVVPVVAVLAGASLHIYLVQFQVFTRVYSPWLGLAGSLLAGIAFARLADPVTRSITRALSPSAEQSIAPWTAPSPERATSSPFVRSSGADTLTLTPARTPS